jgi:succinylglutamate desuccinylase
LREPLKRPLIIFIGNPKAAKENVRHLPDQLDFNRVWQGGSHPQALIAKEVIDYAITYKPLLSIDIHNNSGKNPFYSCINSTDEKFVSLARHFSPFIVFFTKPDEVQSMAFSTICPAVTLEAGTSGEASGIRQLVEKIKDVLCWNEIPHLKEQATIFHTVARFRIPSEVRYTFSDQNKNAFDLCLRGDLEDFNFKSIKEGFMLGHINRKESFWLEGEDGTDILSRYFKIENKQLITHKAFVPAMLTKNRGNIEIDCLGYLMEPWLKIEAFS